MDFGRAWSHARVMQNPNRLGKRNTDPLGGKTLDGLLQQIASEDDGGWSIGAPDFKGENHAGIIQLREKASRLPFGSPTSRDRAR
jgi:hypothetical protein